ncbi:MAG: hypothetical protein ACLFP8_00970 [Alphaproteobacteria bacterium]
MSRVVPFRGHRLIFRFVGHSLGDSFDEAVERAREGLTEQGVPAVVAYSERLGGHIVSDRDGVCLVSASDGCTHRIPVLDR